MISICGENKQNYQKNLEFGETLELLKISKHCILELQVYYDENDKEIYNISIESNNDGLISNTVDYFETRDIEEAKNFYKSIVNMFKQIKEADKNASK